MQIDPLVEWQRLTETYGQMYDDELLQLAADSADLTEQARQALGDEMRKRGLALARPADTRFRTSNPIQQRTTIAPDADPGAPELVSDDPDSGSQTDGPQEYTWKTPLCDCASQDEALQLSEALRRAGIESWIERSGTSNTIVRGETTDGNPRVLVAADQFEEARMIAAQPIPKEIVEQSVAEVPEYQAPKCPKCGAEDPVLEGVDPANTWLCEACEHEWTEAAEDDPEGSEKAK